MKNNTMLDKVIRTLTWVKDLEEGDFISSPGYQENCLDLKSTTSRTDFNILCTIVNSILMLSDYKTRVCRGGEQVRPIIEGNLTDILDEYTVNSVSGDLLIELHMKESK